MATYRSAQRVFGLSIMALRIAEPPPSSDSKTPTPTSAWCICRFMPVGSTKSKSLFGPPAKVLTPNDFTSARRGQPSADQFQSLYMQRRQTLRMEIYPGRLAHTGQQVKPYTAGTGGLIMNTSPNLRPRALRVRLWQFACTFSMRARKVFGSRKPAASRRSKAWDHGREK